MKILLDNKEEIIEKLAEMGLNNYEAKAYITLLQKSNITAYEMSKNSSVPQSKIYETVKKLVDRGLIVAQGSDPVKYSPLPIDEFLERYKSKMEKSINYLKENLKDINSQPRIDYMWHFNERKQILNKVREMIKKAKNKITIEIWEEQLQILKELLEEVEQKGVKIILVLYGDIECDIGEVYYHQMEGMFQTADDVGRWLTINQDGQESLFCIFKDNESTAVWTQNRGFMLLAEAFIAHDIYIAEIYNQFKEELDQTFGKNLNSLRKRLQKNE